MARNSRGSIILSSITLEEIHRKPTYQDPNFTRLRKRSTLQTKPCQDLANTKLKLKKKKKKPKRTQQRGTHKAVIINGVDVLLLGDHVAKATACRVLEGDAIGLGAKDPVDVIAVVELIVKAFRDLDGL